eukprot:Phypoly_transcript_03443.p1 GENE.Phypoly_transcript_03443~~Phypoly_transcript_03443.p1  ORF type:complete len:581 (+),score=160.15 Phypoly_transcript_03443:416-2158(+)
MNRSPNRPDIRVSQDTGQVTKLGSRKSSSSNLTLPPSFRSPTWSTNRTQTPYNPSSTSPSSSPTLSRSSNHSPSPSNSTSPYPSSGYKDQATYNSANAYESNGDLPNGFTRAARPASAGATQQSTKTTEKEYIHNLQQQIQVLELQSKYLRDRETTSAEEDLDGTDLASIGKHMAVLRKKCIALEQTSKARVEELEGQQEELTKKLSYTEHLLENSQEEKAYLKREMERLKMDHQNDRDKLLDDVIAAQRLTEKHARTITALEQNRDRLASEKEKLRAQLSNMESEKAKVESARDAAISAEKNSHKREDDLMAKIVDLQKQLDELKDVKQTIQQIEQHSKEAIKQAADDKWAAELKLRHAESALDQAVAAKSKLEGDCRLAIDESTKLRAAVDELQRELRSEKQKLQTKNSEIVGKAEAEGQAVQKSNQFFQKWKEASEKVISQQKTVENLTQELTKVKQEVEFHKEEEEHLKSEAERQSASYLQMEVESLNTRKENLSLQATMAKLQGDVAQLEHRMSVLVDENSTLQAHHDVLKTRVAMMKEIDKSLTPEELEQMKTANLQMADTVSKLAQKLTSLTT